MNPGSLSPRPRGRALARLLLGLALATGATAPCLRAQDPLEGAAQRDTTPSDPAALGFLAGTVDQRMYTLPSAGARQVQLLGQVRFEMSGRAARSFKYETLIDFASLQINIQFVDDEQHDRSEQLLAQTLAEYALATPPSVAAQNKVLELDRDGAEIRLRTRPRVKGEAAPATEWFSAEGLPLRRRVLKRFGEEELQEETRIELQPIGAGRHVLKREITTAPGMPKKTTTLEYEQQDGYTVLRRITIESGPSKVVGDFRLRIDPSPAPSRRHP